VTKRNIGREIIEGLEEIKAWKRGEIRLRASTVDLPSAADVPGIRMSLGLSQAEFARFMGVSLATLRNWEQRRREPHGPARSLLLVAAKQPRAVIAAFKAGTTRPTRKVYKKARTGMASAARAA
jgi:putative transcriptional regulator